MRIIKKYLFRRMVRIPAPNHFSGFREHSQSVAVEGFTKDHAIKRLIEKWPDSKGLDWEFIEDLEPEHFVGRMGTDLPLFPNLRRLQ